MAKDLKDILLGNSYVTPGSIGGKIKRYRELRGLTQKELGILCGFSPTTADVRIAQYEKNKKIPREKALKDIALALDLDEYALYDADLTLSEQMYHILFDLEDLHGLHPVKAPIGYQLAFGGATIRKRELKKYEYDSFLEEWYEMRQKCLPEDTDSPETIEEKSKEYALWRGEYPTNLIKEAYERRSDALRMEQLQSEMDALNAKMKSSSELEKIDSAMKTVIPEHKSSFDPIEKESDLIYLVKKLLENGLNIEDASPVRPFEDDEDTFHILSVKTEEFLSDEAKTVLFAELYVALKHLQEMGITIYSRINSRDNELYISYYGDMSQFNCFRNLFHYWNDIKFILERQPYWSDSELDELEQKLRSEITGENDVIYANIK